MKQRYSFLVLAVAALLPQQGGATQAVVGTAGAASAAVAPALPRFIPFGVGERMDFQVKYGLFDVGKASIQMQGIEVVRGKPAWKAELKIDGKILFGAYSLQATHTSWFDTSSFYSLRYRRDQKERGEDRNTFFEIFPERSKYRSRIGADTVTELESVTQPLDDASFLYFIRTTPLELGKTYTFERYFRPDRNPVVITVLKKETISVPKMGEIDAIVIQPSIKTKGLFSQGGNARVWLSDDPLRLILRIQSEVQSAPGSLHLNLINYTPPRTRGR